MKQVPNVVIYLTIKDYENEICLKVLFSELGREWVIFN